MFQLPDLPYDCDALEPVISKKIMELHHDKHHAGYVNNVNKAISGTKHEDMVIEELLKNLNSLPDTIRTAVRNNGGGHANHALFWESMQPPSTVNKPAQGIVTQLQKAFGGYEDFKDTFTKAALGRFGSGWAWLVKKPDKSLAVYSTPNQDSPYLQGDTPILGLDVWEHAYYLDYLNDRGAYVTKWWEVVNWEAVEDRLNL
jgi:superoxide dismutase, Fe-Mn family